MVKIRVLAQFLVLKSKVNSNNGAEKSALFNWRKVKRSFKNKLKSMDMYQKEVHKFSTSKDYNTDNVGEFSACTGIPLYYVYYYIWKTQGIPDAKENMLRLLEYYELKWDVE